MSSRFRSSGSAKWSVDSNITTLLDDGMITRVFVIGATGYLGSRIVRRLADAGLAVSGLSRSTAGDETVAAAGGIPFRGDLAEPRSVLAFASEHDTIIYTAQLMLQEEHNLLAAMVRMPARSGRTLIFTSGTGLLSQRTDGDWSEDSFAEDDAFIPSKYIGFRHVTEMLVRSAGWSGATRAMVVRPSMIWGHGGCGHVARFYRDAYEKREVGYLGLGLNLYSNVHVDDLAELYWLALEKGVAGALYHAVSGEVNNRTIAEAVARDTGVPTRSLDFDEAVERWGKFEALIGMATCSRSRAPRSRRELGWQPRHLDLMTDIGHANYLRLKSSQR